MALEYVESLLLDGIESAIEAFHSRTINRIRTVRNHALFEQLSPERRYSLTSGVVHTIAQDIDHIEHKLRAEITRVINVIKAEAGVPPRAENRRLVFGPEENDY